MKQWIFALVIVFCTIVTVADEAEEDAAPVFDETSLTVVVARLGSAEIPAVISGNNAYLSIGHLFKFLKIEVGFSADNDSIFGYIANPDDKFLIDKKQNLIFYQDQTYHLGKYDLFTAKLNCYIHIRHLQDVFGLKCSFVMKSLSVMFEAREDLPIFREMKFQAHRLSLHKRQLPSFIADTVVGSKFRYFSIGTADWAIFPKFSPGKETTVYSRLSVGGSFLGGETTIGINHYSDALFSIANQHYRWRYVNNSNRFIRQVVLGKIGVSSIATLYSPVVGAHITNTPTGKRDFYGNHIINETTIPGNIVELYINDVLVDYTTAGINGDYHFDVPLTYGQSKIKLVIYDKSGASSVIEKPLNIPVNFIPFNELEYDISFGAFENGNGTGWYKGNVNYGLSRFITIGAGNEFISRVTKPGSETRNKLNGLHIPFFTTSISLLPNLLLNAEYNHGIRSKGLLTWYAGRNMMLNLSYSKYKEGQQAIMNNYLEERRASVTRYFRFDKFYVFTSLSLNQMVYSQKLTLTLSDFVLSAGYQKLSAKFHTYGTFVSTGNSNIYTESSLSYRLPLSIELTPSVRYSHTFKKVTGWKIKAEKSIASRWHFLANYESYNDYQIRNLQVGVRYSFKAGQAATYLNFHDKEVAINQAFSGSMVFDNPTNRVITDGVNKVGRGGITIMTFLDLNNNGKRDKDEPQVDGLSARIVSGGAVTVSKNDKLIRIYNLEAFREANIEVSGEKFTNIFWQLNYTRFTVLVEPNCMKLVEVPVIVADYDNKTFKTMAK